MTRAKARSTISALGLKPSFVPVEDPPSYYRFQHWIVTDQQPNPGARIMKNGAVAFEVAPVGPLASEVVKAFESEGLPATEPRDNSLQNCNGALSDCVMLMTTDDISVYEFADEATGASTFASALNNSGAHQNRTIVLSYHSTPSELRPQYEAVLAELMAESEAALSDALAD